MCEPKDIPEYNGGYPVTFDKANNYLDTIQSDSNAMGYANCVLDNIFGPKETTVDGQTIRVISMASPLGAAMVEMEIGDAFEVDTPRGVLEYEITKVH